MDPNSSVCNSLSLLQMDLPDALKYKREVLVFPEQSFRLCYHGCRKLKVFQDDKGLKFSIKNTTVF